MGDSSRRGNQGVPPGPPQGGNNAGNKGATRLVLIGQNMYGAYLYMDPNSKIAVKMEDILSPLESEVWVTFQGDRYMSLGGIEYMLSLAFDSMDRYDVIHPRRMDQGVRTEPLRSQQKEKQGSQRPMQSGSAVPAAQQDKAKAPMKDATAPQMPGAKPAHTEEVSSDNHDTVLYSFKVSRIHVDNPYVVLYTGALGVVYKTMVYPGNTYPQETTVHAWGSKKNPKITLLDEWGKSYHRI